MIETILQDVQFALRAARKSPGFILAAAGILALGIGANTAMFSIVSGVLLRPLPYAAPDQLVQVNQSDTHFPGPPGPVPNTDLREWRANSHTVQEFVHYGTIARTFQDAGELERIQAVRSELGLFRFLGAAPIAGRTFRVDDPADVAVLSAGLWHRRFGADPACIGRMITLDRQPYTIIGVMPESFQFPYRAVPTDLWTPFDIPINPNARLEGVVARLRSGAAMATARNELDVMTRRIDTTHRRSVVLTSVVETVSGKVRTPLFTLLGAVGLVLFIACANVANLLLARSARRSHEIAVRAALGAGRWRLIQQLLTESVLLSTVGAAAGLALAAVLMRVGVRLAGTKIPRSWEIGLDWRVFLFLLSVSVATGVAFGLLPALAVSRTDPQEALGGSSNRAVGASHAGWSGRWLRDGLVVAEIAVSFILLVSAGLVMRAFLRLQNTPVGLNPHDVLTLRLPAAYRDYPAPGDLGRYLMTVEQRVRRIPGVGTAGFIQFLPLQNWSWTAGFSIRGRPAPTDGAPLRCDLRYVSPGYFGALRIPIVRGRAFTEHDVFGQPTSIVVNEALARTYFSGEDPVGRVTDRGTIIGVAGDVRASGLDRPATPEIYYAVAQNVAVTSDAGMTLVVSSATPAATLAPAIRDAIRQINRYQVVYEIKPMDQVIAASLADMNLYTWLIGVFAGIAALLSVSGVYGVIAYAVAARTQEFGLRVALGAGGSQILGLVFRHGAVMVAMGLLVGIGGTFATGRLLESLLRGAKPADLPTLAAVALALAIAGFAACAAPARRAMQVDPTVALRSL